MRGRRRGRRSSPSKSSPCFARSPAYCCGAPLLRAETAKSATVGRARHLTGMSLLKRAEKQGNKFENPVPTSVGGPGMIFKVLPLYLTNKAESEPKSPLGPFRTDAAVYGVSPASGLRVTWFGHSSFLLEIDGLRVLVDPVWEQRASPVSFFGPKRFFGPTLPLEQLPELDAVLISHDHYDHLGAETVGRLSRLNATARARWVTSLGVGEAVAGSRRCGGPDPGAGLDAEYRGRRGRARARGADHSLARAALLRADALGPIYDAMELVCD